MAVLSIIAVVLVLASIPMTMAYSTAEYKRVNGTMTDELERWKSIVSGMQPIKAQYQDCLTRLDWYYGLASTGIDVGSCLKELRVTTPGDAWVTSLDFVAEGVVSISGFAMDFGSVSQFMSQLKLSPQCVSVELVSSKLEAVGGSDAVSFQLRMLIKQVQG